MRQAWVGCRLDDRERKNYRNEFRCGKQKSANRAIIGLVALVVQVDRAVAFFFGRAHRHVVVRMVVYQQGVARSQRPGGEEDQGKQPCL